MNSKNFALIGASGYIAPRHMKAIKDTGHNLVAALDKCDSVGIIDSYFPEASFFTEFERFDRFVEKYHRENEKKIEYMAIATPNYLHDAHIRWALRNGADAICEKPLVLNPWNIDGLKEIEKESGHIITRFTKKENEIIIHLASGKDMTLKPLKLLKQQEKISQKGLLAMDKITIHNAFPDRRFKK